MMKNCRLWIMTCVLCSFLGCIQANNTGDGKKYTAEEIVEFTIRPGEGLGPITFSTTRTDIEKMLGPAERSLLANALEYMSLGIAVTVDRNNRVNQILFGNVCAADENCPLIQACIFKTASGIGMLSSREDIIVAYGEPSVSRLLDDAGEVLEYRDVRMSFTLRNNRVHHIALWSPR